MECCDRGSRWARSIRGGDHADRAVGGHDLHDPHPPRGPGRLTPPARRCGADGGSGSGCGDRAARRTPARSARGRRRRRRCCGRGVRRPGRGSARAGCVPATRCTASTAAQRTRRAALFICGNPERQLAGCPLISCFSGSSRRWLTAPGWCRCPGSGVSPTAQRPEGLDAGAGLAHHHRATEKITSADQVRCMSAPGGGLAWPRDSRGASGAPAYLGARPGARVRRQDGDRGVSTGAAAHSWSAVQPGGRQQQGCRS